MCILVFCGHHQIEQAGYEFDSKIGNKFLTNTATIRTDVHHRQGYDNHPST
jgi:hypothetical protein